MRSHVPSEDRSDILTIRGDAYEQLADYQKAFDDYTLAIYREHGNTDALSGRCRLLARLGKNLETAASDCNEALRVKPDSADALASRCLLNYQTGSLANAMNDCTVALKNDPKNAPAFYLRGLALTKGGYADLGKQDIAAAMAIDTSVADRFTLPMSQPPVHLAEAQGKRRSDPCAPDSGNSKSDAKPDWACTAETDPPAEKTRKALLRRAYGFLNRAQYDNARKDFEEVLRGNAKDAAALYGRGLARSKAGDTASGNADIAEAKSLDPKVADAYAEFDAKK